MSSSSSAASILAACLIFVALGQQVRASGVFELEFIKLEELDLPPKATELQSKNKTSVDQQLEQQQQTNTNNQQEQQQQQQLALINEDPANYVRVLVCLKEAFTSQLDGPCTFGNASITLRRDSIQRSSLQMPATTATSSSQEQSGSQLTNIVRILFTFRWTKSFTIILTAEQLQIDAADNQQSRQAAGASSSAHNRPLLVALRHASNSTPTDSSSQINSNKSTTAITTTATTNTLNYREPNHHQAAPGNHKQQFIDRHVLTENEVLPNLEPNPNKPWASRFSRSLKSSLAYRFRVYCSLNYYGDGCTTFCRPRDDQFGHYNCSSTGQKVCFEGWQGADCDKAKCRPGCNQQHGYCEKPDTCQCRPGWTGARCDECLAYPGCQNGYCLSPWQCICQRNWGGVLCDQDLNYCGTHEPCKNNGTCQNIAPGRYKCNCPDKFTGVDCDINMSALPPPPGAGSPSSLAQLSAGCALNPCLNGGTCFGFNSMLTLGLGAAAYLDPSSPANNNLTLESQQEQTIADQFGGEQYYRCQCAPGWTGDYCQWSDSTAMSITNLLLNNSATLDQGPSNSSSDSVATPSFGDIRPTISEELDQADDGSDSSMDKISPILTNLIENQQHQSSSPHKHHHEAMNIKHLISGVVIASAVGVFAASLLLAWCCLVAIGRNKFSFIQMNIIRSGSAGEGNCDGDLGGPAVASTLRRMHEKIRDSLRRSSRNRIKPETKLSIENVLKPPRPPPTYEESRNNYHSLNGISIEYPPPIRKQHKIETLDNSTETPEDLVRDGIVGLDEGLVIRGALEQKLASFAPFQPPPPVAPISPTNTGSSDQGSISNAQLSCPRHGHMYRQRSGDNSNRLQVSVTNSGNNYPTMSKPTTITIKQSPTYFHHLHNHHNHHHSHHDDYERDQDY